MSKKFSNALIKRVKRTEWFAKVGGGDLPDYVRVADWKTAITELREDSYVNAATESLNVLSERKLKEFKAQGPNWAAEWTDFGDTHDEVMDQAESVADEIARTTVGEATLEKKLLDKAVAHFRNRLMITLAAAELFGDDVEHLDRTFMELFLDGYFPCGYRGKYPNGQIVVY